MRGCHTIATGVPLLIRVSAPEPATSERNSLIFQALLGS